LQATGWSFFQFIRRTWGAFFAPVLTAVTSHIAHSEAIAHHLMKPDARAWSIGWATWMDVIIASSVLWVLSLFALRGFWRPAASSQVADRPAPAHAAGAGSD
jgi:hypothetical protein